MKTKICSKCNVEKNLSDFGKDKYSKDSYTSACKTCRNKQRQSWAKRNPDKVRATIERRKIKPGYHKHHAEYNVEWRLKNPEKSLLTRVKRRCREKEIECNLQLKDIKIPEFCPVLGIPIIIDYEHKHSDNSASVDRIDNTKGYVNSNICIISLRANRIKNDATREELEKIAKYMKDNGQ